MYTELNSDHPIDLCRYQIANNYMGRIGLINSGGASGKNDLAEAAATAVINKRAGGMGLISGRKAFQKPMKDGVAVECHSRCILIRRALRRPPAIRAFQVRQNLERPPESAWRGAFHHSRPHGTRFTQKICVVVHYCSRRDDRPKTTAYLLTGSVGLLSDAAESLVNLLGAIVALRMLSIAARPPDESHAHGHSKAEYFSSGIEGVLILIAAVAIAYAAVQRLFDPQPLEDVGIGVIAAMAASAINFFVARVLLRAGRQYDSITLEADAKHLMTDVWTSVGVIGGVVAVAITGWLRLDPIIALLVAPTSCGQPSAAAPIGGRVDGCLIAEDEQATVVEGVGSVHHRAWSITPCARGRQRPSVLFPSTSWCPVRGRCSAAMNC
jgi:hypothetical protein